MSRLFGGHGLVSITAVGGDPTAYCALCNGQVDRLGWLHVASSRVICRLCFETNDRDTGRLASGLAAKDEQERKVAEAVGRLEWEE
jgi:hypothetical protein